MIETCVRPNLNSNNQAVHRLFTGLNYELLDQDILMVFDQHLLVQLS